MNRRFFLVTCGLFILLGQNLFAQPKNQAQGSLVLGESGKFEVKDCMILLLPDRSKDTKILTVLLTDAPLTGQRRDSLKANPDSAVNIDHAKIQLRVDAKASSLSLKGINEAYFGYTRGSKFGSGLLVVKPALEKGFKLQVDGKLEQGQPIKILYEFTKPGPTPQGKFECSGPLVVP